MFELFTKNHIIFKKIDVENSHFKRELKWKKGEEELTCTLEFWLPATMENGGWVGPLRVTLPDDFITVAMPGEDPLDAFIQTIAFARACLTSLGGTFLFGRRDRPNGGLPLHLDMGFSNEMLVEVEEYAEAFAKEKFEYTLSHSNHNDNSE